jgi:hypothetical protein
MKIGGREGHGRQLGVNREAIRRVEEYKSEKCPMRELGNMKRSLAYNTCRW